MNKPLVSVICTCYNHKAFIQKAIDSVLCQSYPAGELIIVDDASTDGSPETIKNHIRGMAVQLLMLNQNVGLCRAFNEGLKLAKGAFIIDLAGDDELDPERITKGIDALTTKGDQYGVHFGDAEIVAADGSHIRFHSDIYPHASIPQGDVYLNLIRNYFICSPTMMFRRTVIEKLGGYD